VIAAEVRLERTTPLLEQAAETLFEAIALARAEFSFLFLEARRERINRATDQFDALFDQEMFGRRLRITFQELAAATHEVVALDRAAITKTIGTRGRTSSGSG
jgi:hypothetical protein